MLSKNKISYYIFGILIAIFIIIVSKGLTAPQPGDENVYYYMGKLVSEGKVPYRDFFLAHPPLHIYLIALIYKIFGFNIVILKLIPLISTLVSTIFIFCIAKNKCGDYEAIISSLLFLFSYSVMFNSVFSFGIEIAVMFLLIGVYFLWTKNNYILAGIFFGLAAITRLLTLIPILIILIMALSSYKRNFLKSLSAFLIVFLLFNGLFIFLFGNNYIIPVYNFHLLKSFGAEENLKEYIDIIKLNWILFSSALLIVFVKEKKQVSAFAVISIVYLIFLASLKKIFGFYFIATFPFLAIIGGYSIVNFPTKFFYRKILLVLFLSIFIWNLSSDTLFLEKIGFKGFERGKDLTDFIASNSNKNTLLFGDDSVVPLLALLMDRKIAFDFVDTNNEIFISGIKNLKEVLSSLKGKDVLFIIRSKQGISYFSEVKEFLNKNCDFLSRFHDKIEGSYLIYKCK